MPSSCPSEERFPLLLLFLEDGQHSSKHRRILFDKSRYQGIASGATAVITQWPGHLTACWLTAIVIGLAIILVSMMTFAISLRPGAYMLATRCKQSHFYNKENQTAIIHFVHGPSPWTQSQLDTLEQIAQNYQKSTIEVTVIQREINFIDNNDNNENSGMQVVRFSVDDSEDNVTITTTDINIRENTVTVKVDEQKQTNSQTNSNLESGKTSPLKSLKRVKRIKRFLKHRNITPGRKKHYHPWESLQLNINIGTKKLLKMLLNHGDLGKPFLLDNPFNKDDKLKSKPTTTMPKIQSIRDLLKLYSNVHVKNSTYEQIFKQSPLYLTWQNMNQVTRLFAIRVLEMWNYAGITFDMPATLKFPSTKLPSDDLNISQYEAVTTENVFSIQQLVAHNFGKYKKLITIGLSAFENLPEGLVTVDDEGFHMETKTVCHAYFGEILINLKKATINTTPTDVIRKTLTTFCKRGAVDGEYCKTIMR